MKILKILKYKNRAREIVSSRAQRVNIIFIFLHPLESKSKVSRERKFRIFYRHSPLNFRFRNKIARVEVRFIKIRSRTSRVIIITIDIFPLLSIPKRIAGTRTCVFVRTHTYTHVALPLLSYDIDYRSKASSPTNRVIYEVGLTSSRLFLDNDAWRAARK